MVLKFSDMLCTNLQDASHKQLAIRQGRDISVASNGVMKLERISGKDGNITRLPTAK